MTSSDQTSSAEDSPASPSASPARDERRTTTAGSGRNSIVPFVIYDRATSSWRTSQLSLIEESGSSSVTWPKRGMTRDGRAFELRTWERPTDASGSSSLLPTATDSKGSRRNGYMSRNTGQTLTDATSLLLPTPGAQEAGWKNIEVVDRNGDPPSHGSQRLYDKHTGRLVQKGLQQVTALLPTPKAHDGQGGAGKGSTWEGGTDLPTAVKLLPTPTTDDANNIARASGTYGSLARTAFQLTLGDRTPERSDDGTE